MQHVLWRWPLVIEGKPFWAGNVTRYTCRGSCWHVLTKYASSCWSVCCIFRWKMKTQHDHLHEGKFKNGDALCFSPVHVLLCLLLFLSGGEHVCCDLACGAAKQVHSAWCEDVEDTQMRKDSLKSPSIRIRQLFSGLEADVPQLWCGYSHNK